MVVVARVDPHAVHEDLYRAHPEWMAVDPQGNIRHHTVMPEFRLICSHGGYNREFSTEVIKEIVATHGWMAYSPTMGRYRRLMIHKG